MVRPAVFLVLFLGSCAASFSQFEFDTNFRISGNGYFVFEDSLEGDRVLVTKRGDFQLDEGGYVVLRSGLRLQGRVEGGIRYRVSVSDEGVWVFENEEAPVLPEAIGSLRLVDRRPGFEVQRWLFTNELLARKGDGELVALGDHAVGRFEMGEAGELLATSGWQAFVPDVLATAKTLRNVANNSEVISVEKVEQAVSNDFYTRVFPESVFEHGLALGVDSQGESYSSFVSELFLEADIEYSSWIDLGASLVALEEMYPRDSDEALAMVATEKEKALAKIKVVRYETRENGDVIFFLENGDSFVRARILLVDFRYPEELERAGDRLYSLSDYVEMLVDPDGNEQGLQTPGNGVVGSVVGGRLNLPGLLEASVVKQTFTWGGSFFERDPAPFGFMYQQGLKSTNNLADLALSGRGFFRLSDPEREGDYYLTRRGAFQLDLDGYLVNECGFRVMGAIGGSIGYRTEVLENGEWFVEANAVGSDLDTIGEVRLDYSIGRFGEGQPSVYYANELVGVDESGKLKYDGQHAVGTLVFDGDDGAKVLKTLGWQVFLPEVVAGFEALLEGETGLDAELREAIGVAVSNDFYTALFLNGGVYPHGLEPGLDKEGRRYRSFMRELLEKEGWEWPELSAEISALEQMLPKSQYEAYQIIEDMREDRMPKLSRFSVDDEGTVRFFLNNGDSFVRARILLNDVMSASVLIDVGAGCFLVEDDDAIYDPMELGGDKLYEPGQMGFGSVKQGALELLEANGGVESWKRMMVEGDGYILLEDPEEDGSRYVGRSFEYRLSRDGYLETREGYRVLGLTGGSVALRVYVNEWGDWAYAPDDVGGIATPSIYAQMRVVPEVFRSRGRWEPAGPESDPYRDSAFVINDLVAETADGPHRVGTLDWGDDGGLRGTTGWEVLVPEAKSRLWDLSHRETDGPCSWISDRCVNTIWLDLLESGLEEDLWAALSNDVFCSYFPGEGWGHGLVPGMDANGERYLSFVEELMAETQASSGIDLDVVEELADLRKSVYIGVEARKRMTANLVNGNAPWVSGYEVRSDGQIWCYVSSGDHFLAGRMLVVELEAPEQLVEVSEGIWSGVAAARPVEAEDGNAYSLRTLSGDVDSRIRFGEYVERPVDRPTLGLSWRGFFGETYQIMKSVDLKNWWSIRTIEGDGSLIEFVDNWQEDGDVFYRVQQGVPWSPFLRRIAW